MAGGEEETGEGRLDHVGTWGSGKEFAFSQIGLSCVMRMGRASIEVAEP